LGAGLSRISKAVHSAKAAVVAATKREDQTAKGPGVGTTEASKLGRPDSKGEPVLTDLWRCVNLSRVLRTAELCLGVPEGAPCTAINGSGSHGAGARSTTTQRRPPMRGNAHGWRLCQLASKTSQRASLSHGGAQARARRCSVLADACRSTVADRPVALVGRDDEAICVISRFE
jgi:hypothetical protein